MEASAAICGLAAASPARDERLANLKQRAVEMLARTKAGSSSKVLSSRDDNSGEMAGFEDESYGHGTCDDSGASSSSPSFGEVSTSTRSYGNSDRSMFLSTGVAREGRHSGQHSPPSPPSLQRIPLAIAQSPGESVLENDSHGQEQSRREGALLSLPESVSVSPKPVPTTPTRQQQSVSCLASAVEAIQLTKTALATHYPSPKSECDSVDSPTSTGASSSRNAESPTLPKEASRSRRPLPACLRQWDEEASSEDGDNAVPEHTVVETEPEVAVGATSLVDPGTNEEVEHRTESNSDNPLLQLRALLAKQRSFSSSLDHRRLYLGRSIYPKNQRSFDGTNSLTDENSEAAPDSMNSHCSPDRCNKPSADETGGVVLKANNAQLDHSNEPINASQPKTNSVEDKPGTSNSEPTPCKPASTAEIPDDSRAVAAANRIIELVRSVQPSAAAAEVARKRAAAARAETALNVSADGGAALAQQWGACAIADAQSIAKRRVTADSTLKATTIDIPNVATTSHQQHSDSLASIDLETKEAALESSEAFGKIRTKPAEAPPLSTTAGPNITPIGREKEPTVVESAIVFSAEVFSDLPVEAFAKSSASAVAQSVAEAPTLTAKKSSLPRGTAAAAPGAPFVSDGDEDAAGDIAWAKAAPGAVARSSARIAAAEARAEKAEARAEAAERALSCGQRDMEWRVRRAAEAAAEAAAAAAEVAVAGAKRQAGAAVKEAQEQAATAQARVAVAEAEAAATASAVEALAVRDREQAAALEKVEARANAAEARARQATALLLRDGCDSTAEEGPAGGTSGIEKHRECTETVERGSQTVIESVDTAQVLPSSSSSAGANFEETTKTPESGAVADSPIPFTCPECSCASSSRGWPSLSQSNEGNGLNDSRKLSHQTRKQRQQHRKHRNSLSLGGNGDSSLELLDALMAPPPQDVISKPRCVSIDVHNVAPRGTTSDTSKYSPPPVNEVSTFAGASPSKSKENPAAQQTRSNDGAILTDEVALVNAREMVIGRGRVVAAHAAAAAKWTATVATSRAQIASAEEETAQLRTEVQHWRAALEHAEETAQAAQRRFNEVVAARATDITSAEEKHERAVQEWTKALSQERSTRSILEDRVTALSASKVALEADVARLQAWQRSRLARLDRAVDHSLTRRHCGHRRSSKKDGEDHENGCDHDDEEFPRSRHHEPHSSEVSSRASQSSRSSPWDFSLSGSSSSDDETHYSSCSDASVSFHSLSSLSRCQGSRQRLRRQVTFVTSPEKKGEDADGKSGIFFNDADTRARPRNRRARSNRGVLSGQSSIRCHSEGEGEEGVTGGHIEQDEDSSGSSDLLRKLTATLDRSYEFRRVASPSPGGRWARSVPGN